MLRPGKAANAGGAGRGGETVAGTWRTRSLCTRCAALRRPPWPTANARPTTAPWGPGRGPSGPAGNDGPFLFPPALLRWICPGGPAAGLAVCLGRGSPSPPFRKRSGPGGARPPPSLRPPAAPWPPGPRGEGTVRAAGKPVPLSSATRSWPRRRAVSETLRSRRRPIPLLLMESHPLSQTWRAREDIALCEAHCLHMYLQSASSRQRCLLLGMRN